MKLFVFSFIMLDKNIYYSLIKAKLSYQQAKYSEV